MVLAGSFEFDKFHNAEIVERPSDNEEVPMVRLRYDNCDTDGLVTVDDDDDDDYGSSNLLLNKMIQWGWYRG